MELTFRKVPLEHLRQAAWEVRGEEQTQEIRLPDAMPDVGKVLGAWGQVVVRGKEWHGGEASLSGGVMAWVLYVPEDGSDVRCVEGWLPFQLHWDLEDSHRDGSLCVNALLRSVDARSISARKLMVRSSVSVMGQALEPCQSELSQPENVPEDVQLLRRTYPLLLPVEAGEKAFSLEEELSLPASAGTVEKLLCYDLQPELTDRKLMADKVVFRGTALLHFLYRDPDGTVKAWDHEVPFSQFADLEGEYGDDAQVRVIPAVTALELEKTEDGGLHLKAGLIGQYVICRRQTVETVEDAYSPLREVQPQMQQLMLPAVLEQSRHVLRCEKTGQLEGVQAVDTALRLSQPSLRTAGEEAELSLNGSFQVLCYDDTGNLQCQQLRWEDSLVQKADENADIYGEIWVTGRPQGHMGGGEGTFRGECVVETCCIASGGIPTVSGLSLGELQEPDAQRPSLILKRTGGQGLWALAKSCGSTVPAILEANGLAQEPEGDRLLLIPIP